MVKKWEFGRQKQEYVELSNLDKTGSAVSQPQSQLPWYKNFSLQTWRPVVWAGVTVSTLVLVANLVVLFVGLGLPMDEPGTRVLFKGNCKQSSRSYTAWHIMINILSTFLLGASNAASQILAAPTRAEVDKAHAKGKFVHIGVFDFLNLKYIKWRNILLCALIALSSIPLHLLYNSAIFNTTQVFDYYAFAVTPNFVTGGNFSVFDAVKDAGLWNSFPLDSYSHSVSSTNSRLTHPNEGIDHDVLLLQQQAMNSSLIRLGWQDCVRQFGVDLMSRYSAVLLVTADNPNKTNAFWSSYVYNTPVQMTGDDPRIRPYAWMCNGEMNCNSGNITGSGSWVLARLPLTRGKNSLGSQRIDYCLARPEQEACAVEMSVNLMVTVIVCNVIKLCCFLFCLSIKDHKPLVTVGDAVCSFLTRPDPYTVGLGPVSSREVRRGQFEAYRQAVSVAQERLPSQTLVYPGRSWKGKRHKYYAAVGLGRWISTGVLSGTIFVIGLALLLLGTLSLDVGASPFNTNLGLTPNDILTGDLSLFTAVFTANILQLFVSNAYLLINGLFTCALLAQELADYAKTSKTMRVTRPKLPQRSTYWLQLPYRWSMPLMLIMVLLHWLISEAIFMVNVQVLGPNRERIGFEETYTGVRSFYGLAWGPSATLAAVIEGGLLITFLYAYGFLKFPAGTPVLSSCSLAISASSHRSSQESADIIYQPLRYGILKTDALGDAKPAGFTAMDVAPLQAGEVYGGAPHSEVRDPFADPSEVSVPSASLKAQSSPQPTAGGTEDVELLSAGGAASRARSRHGYRRQPSINVR